MKREWTDWVLFGLMGYITTMMVGLGVAWCVCSVVLGPVWAVPLGLFLVAAGCAFGFFTVDGWRNG